MLRNSRFRTSLLALLALAATACGGSDTPATTGPGAAATVNLSSSAFTFVAIGASQAVSATVSDAAGRAISSASVTWTSDDPSIADVSASGVTATVVARKTGTTSIHASSSGISSAASITVLGIKTIVITPATSSIRIGSTQAFTADATVDPGVSRSVTWLSSNSAVATVDATGMATAIAPGNVTITAVAVADSTKSAAAQLTVLPLKGVAVSPATATLATGGTQQLAASVIVDDGTATTVTWTSSAPAVASVSASGLVTAVGLGSATITATSNADNTLKGTATISVVPVVRQVVIAAPASAPFYLGVTQTLTATVTADAGLATTVKWSSSNASVASVDAAGVVTANAPGTAVVTATSTADTTKSASVSVTALSRPVSIVVAPATLSLTVGTNGTLAATVSADPAVSKAVTWTTSSSSVATVSNGVVTAVANGNAIITAASVSDPTKSASVSVSVGPRLAASWRTTSLGGAMIENIVSTYAINATNVFSVNSRGDVFRFDGTSWTRTAQGSSFSTTFLAVHGSGLTNVIAVGTGGKIAQWNGTTWTAMTSPTTQDLNDVWVESATSAFAIGNAGTAVRLTGTTWATTATNSTEHLNAVWFGGSNTWFAVGSNGEVLRWISGTWTRLSSNVALNLYDVYGNSANDVYAVGEAGTVLRFDGATWTIVPSNFVYSNLYTITGATLGGSVLYIGGDRVTLQLANGTLNPIFNDPPYSVQFLSSSVDANGVLWMGGERGVELRNTNGNWATMNIAPDLIDVWATGLTNAWAVGEFGFIYRYNGTTWSRQTSPTLTRLNTVWGASASDAFAGGDGGLLLHFDGTAWTQMTSPTSGDILGMWGTTNQNVYASTYNGEVLRYNGSSWSVVTSQVNPLFAVFGSSASDVYAVGDAGTVLKYNGTAWTPQMTGSTALLAGVWSSAPNNVFSVGVIGSTAASFRYGTAWQALNVGAAVELTSIWGPSPSDVYVSGASGTILRFDGTTWQNMPTGSTEYLWSLTGDPGGMGAGFAVGFNSTLVIGTAPSAPAGLRMAASVRNVATLEPSAEALLAKRAARALPMGAARKSLRGSHAAALQSRGRPPK